MIKTARKLVCFLFIFSFILPAFAQITPEKANKFADFIYIIEGGSKTSYPYGVMSIKTKGNKEKARKITINSINNSYKRWENSGKTNDFVIFFANRWCPPSADKIGNSNWIKNMNFYLNKEKMKID